MTKKRERMFLLAVALLAGSGRADGLDDALDLCRRTRDYVAKSVARERLGGPNAELAALEVRAATAGVDRATVEKSVRALRRRILFLHPDLAFERLLAVQRGVPYSTYMHQNDQYLGRFSNAGPGLVVIDDWKGKPKKREILKGRLPTGTVLNPDLHWDATRVIFAFCDHTRPAPADPRRSAAFFTCRYTPWMRTQFPEHPCAQDPAGGEAKAAHRRYFIYEAALDGSFVRQLTGTPDDPMTTQGGRDTAVIEDYDPCYLPDGGFVFTSTRCQNFGRCHWGRYVPAYTLYRGELPAVGAVGGATGIRPLTFGEANEWEPSVLDDGRLVYTRWDYIDRHSSQHQSLWTVRSDGTGVQHLYGNYSECIYVTTEAKQVPGTRLVAATASAHHGITEGSLVLIDPSRGEDGLAPVERLTPETPFPESEGFDLPRQYCAPQPVNDTLFFCACSTEQRLWPKGHERCSPGNGYRDTGSSWPSRAAYGIWLIDRLGGRELIFQDETIGTFNPIPVVARKRPPVTTGAKSADLAREGRGAFYIDNIYDSRVNLPKGCIAALRVIRILPMPAVHRDGIDQTIYRESLGTVPVAADGSVAFTVPAGTPIQLQAIDANGRAVMTMRSFVHSQAGEVQGCIGCHEPRGHAAPPKGLRRAVPVAPKREIDLGYAGPLSYVRTVQPIFDRHCISCHGLGRAFSLIGAQGKRNLFRRSCLTLPLVHNKATESRPYDFFAAASRLTKIIDSDHGGVRLSTAEKRALSLWMDLNVSYQSMSQSYSFNTPDTREIDPIGEVALRAKVSHLLGPTVAAQPIDALVNRGDPKLSRVLRLLPADSPDRAQLLVCCEKAIRPHPGADRAGTCGRDERCVCRSCWVRRGGYNHPPGFGFPPKLSAGQIPK